MTCGQFCSQEQINVKFGSKRNFVFPVFFINVACEAPAIWFEFDMVQVPYYDAAGS